MCWKTLGNGSRKKRPTQKCSQNFAEEKALILLDEKKVNVLFKECKIKAEPIFPAPST
jgi:hypothetical protein